MKVQEKIEMLAIASLVPYARNSRTHSKEQIAQIGRAPLGAITSIRRRHRSPLARIHRPACLPCGHWSTFPG